MSTHADMMTTPIDVIAGAHFAAQIGYHDYRRQVFVEKALQEWAQGDTDAAEKTFHDGGVKLIDAYQIVAVAQDAPTK